MLTAYESQRRLTRNYLEGARKKRLSYTPMGLWEAWTDLDAAMKVYVGSIIGFAVSVSIAVRMATTSVNDRSWFPPLFSSLAPVASTATMASLVKRHHTGNAVEALNGRRLLWNKLTAIDLSAGSHPSSYSCFGLSLLDHGYCGKSATSKMCTLGHGKLDLRFLQGISNPLHISNLADHSTVSPVHHCGSHLPSRTLEV